MHIEVQVTSVHEWGEDLRGGTTWYNDIQSSFLYTRNFVVPDFCMLLVFLSVVNLFDIGSL
jgi:hypothetical protein